MRSKKPRARVQLSPSIEQRLTSYALAASAAGVGVLVATTPAEGRIIYTPANKIISHGGKYELDLNHDGVIDFTLRNKYFSQTAESTFVSVLSAIPAPGNGAAGWTAVEHGLSGTQFVGYAFALKAGAKVNGARYFVGKKLASVSYSAGGNYYDGSWVNVKNRYLGLQFKIKGTTHYGWARLSVQFKNERVTGTLTGYAYETDANTPIIAGQETDDPNAGGTLSGLAKGWPGAAADTGK
jgi:hypothetical protein